MDSPRAQTRAWSAMVMGLVRKKKPSVMWKSESEVMIVFADMRAMLSLSLGQPAGLFIGWCSILFCCQFDRVVFVVKTQRERWGVRTVSQSASQPVCRIASSSAPVRVCLG